MRSASHWKNVFCIEGMWEGNLKSQLSVEPMLRLICGIDRKFDYIYRSAATVGEMKHYIKNPCKKLMQTIRFYTLPIMV